MRKTSSLLADDAEHRRTDEIAGNDLADDRWDADALRELGRELGRDEDDEDVEEDGADVHGAAVGSCRRQQAESGHDIVVVPALAAAVSRMDQTVSGDSSGTSCVGLDAGVQRDRLLLEEVGVGECSHLGDVQAGELDLGLGPDATLRERVLDLEEGRKAMPNITVQSTTTPAAWAAELPEPGIQAVEDPGHALDRPRQPSVVKFQPAP